jgi:ferredoxin-NADP reductase
MRLVYSVRNADDVIYAEELGEDAIVTYTREAPDEWSGHTGRIDAGLIADALPERQIAFVCGSNGFVEAATRLLIESGCDAARIRTERFGPTG